MTSVFGWLDQDDAQRRKMIEVVELFRSAGTVDELGIGAIRDTIADALFPTTSVLHTRARYLLFVPWLMDQASHEPSVPAMVSTFRKLEIKLIGSLLAGGENEGVIGQQARDKLKQTPAFAYGAALRSLAIRQKGGSNEALFRYMSTRREVAAHTPHADDPDAVGGIPRPGLDPQIPSAPPELLTSTTFDLTQEEESYLSDRIATATQGSLYAWLVRHWSGEEADRVWQLNTQEFPRDMANLVDHARRFHTAIHGAALLYNLQMAQKADRADLVVKYVDGLAAWRDELESTSALDGWNRHDWWATLARHNPRLNTGTQTFVDEWLDLIVSDPHVERGDHRARALIERRERRMKGGRARLANRAALDRWGGDSGLGRLNFRWNVAQTMLRDLYVAKNGGT